MDAFYIATDASKQNIVDVVADANPMDFARSFHLHGEFRNAIDDADVGGGHGFAAGLTEWLVTDDAQKGLLVDHLAQENTDLFARNGAKKKWSEVVGAGGYKKSDIDAVARSREKSIFCFGRLKRRRGVDECHGMFRSEWRTQMLMLG